MDSNFREIARELANKHKDLYMDFNYFLQNETRMEVDTQNTEISKGNDCGIKIRLWDGEKFLESASSATNRESIEEMTKSLIERYKKSKEDITSTIELKTDKEKLEKEFKSETKNPITSISLEEKTDRLKKLKDDILKIDEDILNVRVLLVDTYEKHQYVNKYKSLSQEVILGKLIFVAYIKCFDGLNRMAFKSFVDNDLRVFDTAYAHIKEFEKEVRNMKKAKKLSGGKYKVLLSPHITGLLAHESFGHGMEADTMMKDRALASKWIGKKVGSDIVNIVDYPKMPGKHGEFYFDHEGNQARKTYLVKNGIINEPMAGLYSKTQLDLKNSSNSRFESFDHKNYNRMSNTYFEAGPDSFEEMLSSIEDGIYICGSAGGMEDPKGWGVQIQGCSGIEIKNGKLTENFFDGFAITGFLPDIMKNIQGVSKEFDIDGGGFCGKGHKEWVRVSEGGPYLLISELVLG